jgi:hypothetical protein
MTIILGEPFLKLVGAFVSKKRGAIYMENGGRKEAFTFLPNHLDCCDQLRVFFKESSKKIEHVEQIPCAIPEHIKCRNKQGKDQWEHKVETRRSQITQAKTKGGASKSSHWKGNRL